MHLLDDVSTRLQQERKRIGLSQEAFGNEVGVSKRTQAGYEGGSNAPDALYLIGAARLGVDIAYVLFGLRSESSLNTTEQTLINLFRSAPGMLQAAALGALQAGLTSGTTGGVSSPPATVKIKEVAGQMNTASVSNQATTMNFGTKGS